MIRYRRPVPLQTPLHLRAAFVGVDGRIVTAQGSIATEAEPMHGFPQSLNLRLPPLAALVLEQVVEKKAKKKVAAKKHH